MKQEGKLDKAQILKQGRETIDFYNEMIKKDPQQIDFWCDLSQLKKMCDTFCTNYTLLDKKTRLDFYKTSFEVMEIFAKIAF